MPGKITSYKKIARSLVDRCTTTRSNIAKCIRAFLKEPKVLASLRGTLLVVQVVISDLCICAAQGLDYECALEITQNIKKVLHSVRYLDRYNGVRQAILGACTNGKHITRTADLLGVCIVLFATILSYKREK